jgi:twitching motility protein PilT
MDSSLAGLVREQKITMAAAEARSSEPAEMRKLVHSPGAASVTSAPPTSVAA